MRGELVIILPVHQRAAQLITIDPVKHIELLALKQLIKSCFSNQYKSQLIIREYNIAGCDLYWQDFFFLSKRL